MTRDEALDFISRAIKDDVDVAKMYEALMVFQQPEQTCEDAISRAEAIKAMNDIEQEDIELYGCHIPEGFDGKRAIEALHSLPSVALSAEPCKDAVSREAAVDALKQAYWDKDMQNAKDDPCIVDAMTDWAIRTIKDLPSVKPQPKTGHWIYSIYGGFHEQGDWLCSHCNYQFNYGNGHAEYCPKCGYEMSETSTEEVISEYDPRRSNKDYKMW